MNKPPERNCRRCRPGRFAKENAGYKKLLFSCRHELSKKNVNGKAKNDPREKKA